MEKRDEKKDLENLLLFLDADSNERRMELLRDMQDELDDYLIASIAASMEITIEDGRDGYDVIMQELEMKSMYEKMPRLRMNEGRRKDGGPIKR